MGHNGKSVNVVTIDGPAGSGKSTLARRLATRLGWAYLDSGALYRAVTWLLLQSACEPVSGETLENALCRLDFSVKREGDEWVPYSQGEDLRPYLRRPEITGAASAFSALPELRRYLLRFQREAGKEGQLVSDGRDMGSVVFPEAKTKFFLDAQSEVRAKRRFLELEAAGHHVRYDDILNAQKTRDQRDSARAHAPLIVPKGAFVVDTSDKDSDEVLEILLNFIDNAP